MDHRSLLADAFDRVGQSVHACVEGLDEEALSYRIDGRSNSIAWLVWHLTRIQDDHMAGVAGTGQVWVDEGWAGRCGLPFPEGDTGFGHGSDDVAAVRLDADLLLGYYDATHQRTQAYVETLTVADLEEVIDERWDPPVTRAVRLVSVISDDLQHAGQAALLRGLLP